jgi:hypothetical protein
MAKRRNQTPKDPHDRNLLITLLGFLGALVEFAARFWS